MSTCLEQLVHNTEQALGYTHPKCGQSFASSSPINGETTNYPHFYVKQNTGVASGDIYFRCWDSSGTLLHTYGTYDSANLTSSFQLITPTTSTEYTTPLAGNDIIGMEFTGSSSQYYSMAYSSTNQIGNGNYFDYKSSDSSWHNKSPADMAFKINCAPTPPPPTSSGTRLPPPPIVVRF